MASVEPPQAPALPHARKAYKKADGDTYTAILRLFFNRLTALLRDLLSSDNGGTAFYFPHAEYYSTATQSQITTTSAIPVEFNTTQFAKGITLNSNTQMQVEHPGRYRIDFDGWCRDSVNYYVYFSIRKNGAILNGNSFADQVADFQLVSFSTIVEADADDYFEVLWAVDNTALQLGAVASQSYHGYRPSAKVGISFVSNV